MAAWTRRRLGRSRPRRHRPAQVARPGDPEAPGELGRARDPDARAAEDLRPRFALAQLERRLVERELVVVACHAERLAEPSRAGREQPRPGEARPGAHRAAP